MIDFFLNDYLWPVFTIALLPNVSLLTIEAHLLKNHPEHLPGEQQIYFMKLPQGFPPSALQI